MIALISGGVLLANIDFSTQRVDRTRLSIETVQYGRMEIEVGANGQWLSSCIERLAARVPGRAAKADIKPGAVVRVGQVLVELTNPELTAGAEEAQSAHEGAVAELQAVPLLSKLAEADPARTRRMIAIRAVLKISPPAPTSGCCPRFVESEREDRGEVGSPPRRA